MYKNILSLTERFAVDGAPVEDHDILCECPRFVTEDVFDLAELFVQRGGSSFGRSVAARVVHLPVPVNVVAVPQPNDLHTAERSGYRE